MGRLEGGQVYGKQVADDFGSLEPKSAAFRFPLAAGRWPISAGRFPPFRFPLAAFRWPLAAFRKR